MDGTSLIEISEKALRNNLNFIREVIGEKVEFVSVVKGNAYGHGIEPFVPLAIKCGVKSFAVFSASEAEEILNTKLSFERLIVMGVTSGEEIEWIVENEIEFFVFNLESLYHAVNCAIRRNKKAKIHIELETGLNRTGFNKEELDKVFSILKTNREYVIVEGICSHLAGAESISNYVRIKKQIISFNKIVKLFKAREISYEKLHLACSAAIINYPKTIYGMARIGIMQYGFWPSKEVQMSYLANKKEKIDPLTRVISWKSKVMNIKEVNTGEYIGYGNTALAETDAKIAIVPVGYAHGFSRSLSNQGRVLISGMRVNVVGMVNMNMIMVDITNVPNVKKGDEVVLIGNQGNQSISVASFGDLSVQLNYELLTRLPRNLSRTIIE